VQKLEGKTLLSRPRGIDEKNGTKDFKETV
jgi:hypothetical protein